MECPRCAFPNSFWNRRCERCGASLHRKRVLIGLPIAVAALLVALLLLLSGR